MLQIVVSTFSLLSATAMLLLGIGLQGTLLSLRAEIEAFDATTIGIIMSSYFAGFAAGTYICPAVISRVGHIRAYATMATIASVAAVLFSMTDNPVIWSLLRVLTGICLVGLYMIIESWLNILSPTHSRGKFFSTYVLITLLATAGGQYFLLLYEPDGYELFVITSVLISLALVPIALTRISQPEIIAAPNLNLGGLFRQSPQGIFGTLMSGVVVGAFYGMIPLYAARLGLGNEQVANLLAITILGGAMLQWPIGLVSDRHDRRRVLMVISIAGAMIAFVLFVSGPAHQVLFYGLNFLFGGVIFSLYGLSVAHVIDRVQSQQTLQATRGLMQVYGAGAVLGPLVAALCMRYIGAESMPVFFAVSLLLLALFTMQRIASSEAPAEEEQTEFVMMNDTSPVVLEMSPQTQDS